MTQVQVESVEQNVTIIAQQKHFQDLKGFLKDLVINNENAGPASDCLRCIKLYIKTINEERLRITRPLDEEKNEMMAKAKLIIEPMEYEKDGLEKKLLAYQVEQRRLEEERLRFEKAEEEKRLERIRDEQIEQAELSDSDLAIDDAVATEEKLEAVKSQKVEGTGRIRAEMSVSSITKSWDFELIDITEVPAMYLILNESKVRAVIRGKHGERHIKGLKIFQKDTLSTRGRG